MSDLAQLDEQERNRLIALIAEKHGVLLGRDDPILIIHTLHNELVSRLATSEAEVVDRFSGQIEEVASRWQRDAKDKAEKVLSAALTASSGAFDKRLKEATAIAISEIETAGKKRLRTLPVPPKACVRACISCLVLSVPFLSRHCLSYSRQCTIERMKPVRFSR